MNLTFTASISDSRSFKAHLNQAGLRINEWHKALWFSPFVHGQEKLFQDLLASFRSAFDNLFLCIINPEFRAESALMSSVLQTHKLVGLRSIWETRSCWEWLHLCINLSGVLLHAKQSAQLHSTKRRGVTNTMPFTRTVLYLSCHLPNQSLWLWSCLQYSVEEHLNCTAQNKTHTIRRERRRGLFSSITRASR